MFWKHGGAAKTFDAESVGWMETPVSGIAGLGECLEPSRACGLMARGQQGFCGAQELTSSRGKAETALGPPGNLPACSSRAGVNIICGGQY